MQYGDAFSMDFSMDLALQYVSFSQRVLRLGIYPEQPQ